MRVVRFSDGGEAPRLGIVDPDAPATVLELEHRDVLAVLRGERDVTGRTIEALDAETLELPPPYELLAPLVPPTVATGDFPVGVADTDVLIVDDGMIPFLRPDWAAIALKELRHPRILQFGRDGRLSYLSRLVEVEMPEGNSRSEQST